MVSLQGQLEINIYIFFSFSCIHKLITSADIVSQNIGFVLWLSKSQAFYLVQYSKVVQGMKFMMVCVCVRLIR